MFLIKLVFSLFVIFFMLIAFGFMVFAAIFPESAAQFIRWMAQRHRTSRLVDRRKHPRP